MWYVRQGSRVLGPLSQDQLRSMRKRGQISSFHQVSLDGENWGSAADLVRKLDGVSAEWSGFQLPNPSLDSRLSNSSSTGFGSNKKSQNRDPDFDESESSVARWHYSDRNRNVIGPVDLATLQELLRTRQIKGSTQICRHGDTRWSAAKHHPELRNSIPQASSQTLLVILSSVAGALLLVGLIAGFSSLLRNRPLEPDHQPTLGPRAPIIHSVQNREQLSQAVGLVVHCLRVTPLGTSAGERGELTLSTGSCFAITEDGYLLTNRHVVEDAKEPSQETLDANGKKLPVRVESLILVFFDRIRHEAKIVHTSSKFDMAILKVDRPKGKPFFSLSMNQTPKETTPVFAIGFPALSSKPRDKIEFMAQQVRQSDLKNAENQLSDNHFIYSITTGIISRNSIEGNRNQSIEHTAQINPGNSGGPLTNGKGVVLGINTAFVSDQKAGAPVFLAYNSMQFRKEIEYHVSSPIQWVFEGDD